MATILDLDANYKVEGYSGIAWYPLGYVMARDEDYEWTGIEIEDTSRVRMVMVGDDRVFTFDIDEIEVIPEDSFCHSCGQIGCGHNVYA